VPLDRRAERLLKMLAAGGASGGGYERVEERRRALDDLVASTQGDPPAVFEVSDTEAPGPGGSIPLRLYRPTEPLGEPAPALVFFHGGGWVAGGRVTHDAFCRRLAVACGCTVILADYRLAPEHPFPRGLGDCLAVVQWLAANGGALGVDPGRLMVGGDSAGGGLAAAVCVTARDGGGPSIALQLLICPILDMAGRSASRRRLAVGYFLDEATLTRDLELYRPLGVDRADPRLSPLRGKDLSGLPATLIHTAEFDPFIDEGEAYRQRLEAAGTPVRFTCHPGMIHFFYAMPAAIPYALDAITAIGREVKEAISASSGR